MHQHSVSGRRLLEEHRDGLCHRDRAILCVPAETSQPHQQRPTSLALCHGPDYLTARSPRLQLTAGGLAAQRTCSARVTGVPRECEPRLGGREQVRAEQVLFLRARQSAEREGFEPSSDQMTRTGFRDRRIQPLCHLSGRLRQ